MYQHLLVPLDGSRLAEAVLPATLELARRCHARVTLLHILETAAPATIHGDRHLRNDSEAETYLNDLAAHLDFPRARLSLEVHPEPEADVARSIFHHASELKADLVVLSTHGYMGLREWLLGSVPQKVLRPGAPPVLMLQPTPKGQAPSFKPDRGVVYLEGTTGDEAILRAATELARQCGAALHLVRCVPTRNTLIGPEAATGTLLPATVSAMLDLVEREAAEALENQCAKLKAQQIAVTAQVTRGDVLKQLLEVVHLQSADILCLTTHGESGLAALGTEEIAPRILNQFRGAFLLVHTDD